MQASQLLSAHLAAHVRSDRLRTQKRFLLEIERVFPYGSVFSIDGHYSPLCRKQASTDPGSQQIEPDAFANIRCKIGSRVSRSALAQPTTRASGESILRSPSNEATLTRCSRSRLSIEQTGRACFQCLLQRTLSSVLQLFILCDTKSDSTKWS